jgi:homoserine dehydrogenase
MEPIVVGLFGLGTVGSGVARVLLGHGERLRRRSGRWIELRAIVVRDPDKERAVDVPSGLIVTDPGRVLDDPEVSVVIEAMGGTDPTLDLVCEALARGKDVVTANKALLAEHGPEVFAHARRFGRSVSFEASVGGGIPIVHALGVSLAGNQVQSVSAILNGTCNFILTSMTREGLSYEAALRMAQERGYAEADPTLDVDGTDTAHKLAVLAQLCFGASLTTRQIPREGIDRLQPADIRYAGELGYAIKLLALAHQSRDGLAMRVAPTLVRMGTPLADVSGPYNAIRVVGDVVGDTLFFGRGAGQMPTASAVAGDLIDVVTGRAALTFHVANLWPDDAPPPRLTTPQQVHRRYYLRFTVADRPGSMGTIAQVLGRHGVSIASIIQHEPSEETPEAFLPIVLMTHTAVEASVLKAVDEIDRLEIVRPPSVSLGVEA